MSPLHRQIREKIQQYGQSPEKLARALGTLLREQGIPVRRGWEVSQLATALEGVIDRHLGDSRLSALGVCALLEHDFRLGLVDRGLLTRDAEALAWLSIHKGPSHPVRPR